MKKLLNFIKWMLLTFLVGSILFVLLYRYVRVPFTPLMVIRSCQQLSRGEDIRWYHQWVPIDSISPHLATAVWACEDQNFLRHNGFDYEAIQRVIEERQSGERYRGGSTISQQTAKNVFLFPTSSGGALAWIRKGTEAYFTVLIELMWSKKRIMEVYLNSIEMGDGIYGAQAVAQQHFNCNANRLTRNQCALIAITLPNPIAMDSSAPTPRMYKRQMWCIKQMNNLGDFNQQLEKMQQDNTDKPEPTSSAKP